MSKCSASMPNCNHHTCKVGANSSLHQTLDEMEFERGIWYAAQTGDQWRVSKLLNDGKGVDMVDGAGYTALHYAARSGHLSICELLIKSGANVDAATRSGQATSLHRACSAGKTEIVQLLLKTKANCTVKDSDGKTALHRAAESGNFEICQLIVNSCPQIKFEPDNKGNLPAQYAKDENISRILS